jgi:RimJ/RimL family protein N-acetyltransferase
MTSTGVWWRNSTGRVSILSSMESDRGARVTLTDGVVFLDQHTLADVDAHWAGEDEEMARRFEWYPKRSTLDQVRAAIVGWRESWRTGGFRRTFAVRDAATRVLVGGCEVRLGENGVAQMSYWVFPPHRRRGVAVRATNLACEHAFAAWGVRRMELEIAPDNAASRGVARRAGFAEEVRSPGQPSAAEDAPSPDVLYVRRPSDPPVDR